VFSSVRGLVLVDEIQRLLRHAGGSGDRGHLGGLTAVAQEQFLGGEAYTAFGL
jgi:hypothetical protein